MKVKVLGDVMSIVSDINFDQLKKATNSKALKFLDKDGAEVYAVGTGIKGDISTVGVVFTYANTEGKAALNISIPAGTSKEAIARSYGDELATLKSYEADVVTALTEISAKLAEVEELIEEV